MYKLHNALKTITGTMMCCLLQCIVCMPAHAATPPIYDVEVIIFTNNASNDGGEHWSRPYPDRNSRSGIFPDGQFTELSQSHYKLNGVRNGLERSGNYSVLFHRAWRQLAHNKARAVAYPLHSIAANGRDSIEGSITLVRERFLHLEVNALLMSALDGTGITYSDAATSTPLFELREKRRIRTKELHYFDHPRFGMIAQVTPYSPENSKTETENKTAPASTSEQIQREIDKQVNESSPADDQLTR